MKTTVLLACLLIGGLAEARADTTNSSPRVTLELQDGCRIVGSFAAPSLALESDMLGKFQMPFERVARISLLSGQTNAVIELWNKDTLKANIPTPELQFNTAFGQLQVPLRHIAEMKFSATSRRD